MNSQFVHEAAKSDSDLRDVLICPGRDLRIESRLDIPLVKTVPDLVTQLSHNAAVLSLDDIRLVEMISKYADLFGIKIGVLDAVPGCMYDEHWAQITFPFDHVSYDSLVMDLQSQTRMDALKKAESTQKVNSGEEFPDNSKPRHKPSKVYTEFGARRGRPNGDSDEDNQAED